MAVSRRLRFEIFRRDNFACRYCGKSAHDGAILEPDHVNPVSRGGRDTATNLVTACLECNSGKSDTPISAPPIEDVPQDTFRRACAERNLPYTALLHSDSPPDLASQILSLYPTEEYERLEKTWQHWHLDKDADETPPEEPELRVQIALEVFLNERCDRMRLEDLVHRLIFLLGKDAALSYGDHADELRQPDPEEPSQPLSRETAVLAIAAERLAEDLEERAFNALSAEEQAEWMAYATALRQDPFGGTGQMSLESHLRYAAEAASLVNAGWHHTAMCRGKGRHIGRCPHRPGYRVWVRECAHCDPADEKSSHLLCPTHVEHLKAGKHIQRGTDTPATIAQITELGDNARELT